MQFYYDARFEGIMCKPDCVEEVLELMEGIAIDYDGEGESKQGLRNLVDELRELANQARVFLGEGKIYFDPKTDEENFFAAKADKEAHANEWKVGK